MSSYASQLHEEQQAVDRAYGRLDDLRAEMWQRLDTVRAAGSHGSPTQRSERDSFATMYENRLTQLRSVEDRLVFGRLDAKNGDRHYIGRIGLSSPDHEPILTDWRAEAARPFYEATPSNHGDIVMRRHITLSFREVVGVEDEVLDVHSDQVGQASSAGDVDRRGCAAGFAELTPHRQDDRYRGHHSGRAGPHHPLRHESCRGGARAAPAPARRPWRSIAPPTCCTRTGARWNVPACCCWPQLGVPALHRSGAALLGRDRRGLTHHQRSDSRHHRHGGRLPLCSQAQGRSTHDLRSGQCHRRARACSRCSADSNH